MASAGYGSEPGRQTPDVRFLVDAIPTLAWSAHSDGSADSFNQRWLDYTGLSPEQARDWGWTVALHPDDLNGLVDYWRSVLASDKPGEIEGRLRRFDGVYRWFLFRATPSIDNDGRVAKWFGTNTDIEDRKRAEDALRSNEQNLRLILDTIPGFVCALSAAGEVELVNRQVLEYFGKTTEELKNWATSDAVHPDDLPRVIDAWRRSVETGEPYVLELRQRRADGVYRWFQSRALPARDTQGGITGWYMLLTDIDDRRRAEDTLRSNEQSLRLIVDSIPGFVSTANAAGEVELVNRQVLEYFGKTTEELKNWATGDPLHPDDLPRLTDAYRRSIENGWPRDVETRSRGADGVYRWFHLRSRPQLDAEGRVVRWYTLATDIDDRKRAEEALRASERDLRLIFETIPGFVWTTTAAGEVELVSQQMLEYFGKTLEELKEWPLFVHPDDRARVIAHWRGTIERGQAYEVDHRLRRADGVYRWFHGRGLPLRDTEGHVVRWYNLLTDIDERRQAEEKLRLSEAYLAEAQRLSLTGSFGCKVSTGEMIWSEETFRIFGYDRATKPAVEAILQRVHPEDKAMVQEQIDRATREGKDCDLEYRLLLPDDSVKHVRVVARALRDETGSIEFVGALMDLTEQRQARADLERAFDEIAKSEAELRTIIDAIPQLIIALGADGNFLHPNQAVLEYTGLTKEEVTSERFYEVFHPEDSERLRDQREAAISRGVPFEYERRVRRRDGQYRWLLVQYNPLLDRRGKVIRWYATGTDIDDRKQAEERTRQENVALREQIDQVFMFEEIVGSSPALKTVLSSIVKVAPTDSTVLIAGETGTGKELVARAIHKGSQRAGHAFIAVNCASIPASLIASELFGHEKGAFTGALQRRQGRFELAHSGTIFLDEIGELPAETQVALLRVLQERQFERVGGSRVISTDVRIIAASNRDLAAAIAAGTFRADLFYRLNVFPIHVPPLRNRKEDIPMLVEYFVGRYAEKARKQISKIDKNTLKLCQSYPWPGNIRELQNIVERSVILCTGDTFWIDEAWLSSQDAPPLESSRPLIQSVQNYERQLIEAALAESNGKIAGPNGAAAKLGIPRSTLDAKIKQLNIKKHTTP